MNVNTLRLARTFIAFVRDEIMQSYPSDWQARLLEIDVENDRYARAGAFNTCHSHHFVDANVCMIEAVKRVYDLTHDEDEDEATASSQLATSLAGEAWELAKALGFSR